MEKQQFIIEIQKGETVKNFAFTRSVTGTLDYDGLVKNVNTSEFQRLESSTYFSRTWYTYLPKELQASITLCLPCDMEEFDASQNSFLMHVGAILLAIEENDPLLAAELLNRRIYVFKPFAPLMQYLLKPIAAEALFAWTYGRLNGFEDFLAAYKDDKPLATGEGNTASILFAAARQALKPKPLQETPEEMFIRYFQQKPSAEFTIGIVGAPNHPWIDGFDSLNKAVEKSVGSSFTQDPTKVAIQKQAFLESLDSNVQTEPYNPHDPNAIAIFIDDIESKLKGMGGKSKAGFIRATGAAILRKSKPGKFAYKAKLWRIGKDPSYFDNAIIMRITI